ncbi:MdtP2 [Desulforapulum autotrophicum HRM2]|uniref:MdtP2 n=1 Tax=Desulforapulum autotrophicum (strain ATCC 43914 / DSM 3382 / VKM B-1955 / HRM2) TaxID=177437 RepID=C0QC57_DESAH|nr:efflux transporter outer membrane subunit [Desulforapulum autotrophicum]ACN17074.1 MdtP2 [Desulforapulum autotrophicum HRM2]
MKSVNFTLRPMAFRCLTVLALIILLGGCSLAPRYTRPPAPVPGQWPQGAAYKSGDVPALPQDVQSLAWQAFFTDPRLQQVIETALENNRDLRLAALNLERVRGVYGIQRAEFYPVVDFSGSASKLGRSRDLITTSYPRTIEQYTVDFGIAAWEIDFFGRLKSLKDQALEEYLATDQARSSAQIALMAEVARTYFTLAADQENLALARATLENQQASFDLIQKSYNAGLVTEIDLHQAQTQVDAAKRDVPRFTQLVAQDKNALTLLAGGEVPEALLPAGLDGIAALEPLSPGLSSAVLLNRPDIVAAEHRLKGANAFIGAARATLFPRISLTGALGTASDDLAGLFKSDSSTWNFTPQISVPIFDARAWAALGVSKTDRRIILTQYERAIQTAFREVADALAVQGTIDDQLAAQKSLVNSVAATYDLSGKRYNMGLDSYLGVLDAHRSLYTQQQVLISLRLTRLASQVTLYAVLGGGGNPPMAGGDL